MLEQGSDRPVIPAPMESAFDDLEGWVFLALAAQLQGGWIADAAQYLQNTAMGDQIDRFLDFNVPKAEDVVGSWEEIQSEVSESLVNPFLRDPIVQVRHGLLLAPDPGTVFPALAVRIIRKVREELRQPERDQDRRHIERRIGGVYESYVADLVQECATWSAGENFVPEFELCDGTRSPDAHLRLADHVLLVEAKSSQVPEPPDSLASPEGLVSVMARAAGQDDAKGRGPLEQTLAFLQRWAKGDENVLRLLGEPPESCTVLLVSPIEWPVVTPWARFREACWRPGLCEAAQMLDQRVVFLNHHDLETAAMLLCTRHRAGHPSTLLALVDEWMEATRRTILELGPDGEVLDLRGGLGDFLFTRYPSECRAVLPMLSEAADEFFLEAARRGFPKEATDEARLRSTPAECERFNSPAEPPTPASPAPSTPPDAAPGQPES